MLHDDADCMYGVVQQIGNHNWLYTIIEIFLKINVLKYKFICMIYQYLNLYL